ncbi:c-type cytochrome [Novosphingobium bradum]|uniref:C-type cytochrome n=1 Tax=Novosphingobium bradum TaxID=1737444 RepID=A0ABV7IRR8_9SPHN
MAGTFLRTGIMAGPALALALALALAGCGSGEQAGSGEQPAGGEVGTGAGSGAGSGAGPGANGAAGQVPADTGAASALAGAPAAFAQCAACHSPVPGKHGIGPSLAGVYGTKAGEIAGYAFSPALKASGLTWDDATLDKWLAGPMRLVPGTRMTYAGQSDPAKRAELIAWLKTLK